MAQVMTTKMSSRGQVVIPEAMRNQFGWGVGTSFIVEVYRGSVIMQPIRPTPASQFAKRFDELLDRSRSEAKSSGLRPEDVAEVIADYREERRRERTGASGHRDPCTATVRGKVPLT